jgi:hypothetical protein
MESIKEKSLIEALAFCSLKDLPKETKNDFVWIKALALVAKSDGSQSYVYLIKDEDGKPKVKKDFGHIAVIKEYISIHPFMLLNEKFMPTFKGNSKEERIEWLTKFGCKEPLEGLTVKELNKKVLNMAMQNALRSVNS